MVHSSFNCFLGVVDEDDYDYGRNTESCVKIWSFGVRSNKPHSLCLELVENDFLGCSWVIIEKGTEKEKSSG